MSRAVAVLERYRAMRKRRLEVRLAAAHDSVQKYREKHPLAQGQLERNDKPYSRREYLERAKRDAFTDLVWGPERVR